MKCPKLIFAGLLPVKVRKVDRLASGLRPLFPILHRGIIQGIRPHIFAEDADDARHVFHRVVVQRRVHVVHQGHAIQHRSGGRPRIGTQRSHPGGVKLLRGQVIQLIQAVHPQVLLDFGPNGLHQRGYRGTADLTEAASTGEHDGPADQSVLHQRRDEQILHTHRPGALSHDRNALRVPAVIGDVIFHPAQSSELIGERQVAGVAVPPDRVERAQAVVNGHRDNPVVSVCLAVRGSVGITSGHVRAPVDIHQHWAVLRPIRSPDIQVQAVLAVCNRDCGGGLIRIELADCAVLHMVEAPVLATPVPPYRGVVYPFPAGHWLSLLPPLRRGVTDSPELLVAILLNPLDLPAGRIQYHKLILCGCLLHLFLCQFFSPQLPFVPSLLRWSAAGYQCKRQRCS